MYSSTPSNNGMHPTADTPALMLRERLGAAGDARVRPLLMPNGHDAGWVRLCGAVDGFRARYGCWPTRILLSPTALAFFRDELFTAEDYARITDKVQFVPREGALIAQDDFGRTYNYWADGFPKKPPSPSASEWFGVHPKPES